MGPAVVRFGVLVALAGGACWTGGEAAVGPAEPEAQPAGLVRDVTGPYWCTLYENTDMPEQPTRYACAIRREGDRLMLVKLAGEQRVRGQIVLDDRDGFTFVGEMYCPEDDCEKDLRGRFRPTARGGFKGRFPDEDLVMRLTPAPPDAFEIGDARPRD